MNKIEEILKLYEEDKTYLNDCDYITLIDYLLKQDNRIDKALEYIETNKINLCMPKQEHIWIIKIEELEKILKGE